MRCYDRICEGEGGDTPFFEFRWGYFFNDVTFGEGGAWPSYEERTEFLKVIDRESRSDELRRLGFIKSLNSADTSIRNALLCMFRTFRDPLLTP